MQQKKKKKMQLVVGEFYNFYNSVITCRRVNRCQKKIDEETVEKSG